MTVNSYLERPSEKIGRRCGFQPWRGKLPMLEHSPTVDVLSEAVAVVHAAGSQRGLRV